MKTNANLIDHVAWPDSGHYVVAVSGGIDSMALLHLLVTNWLERLEESGGAQPHKCLRVAHFDHGSRPDSGLDARLVEQAASIYGLPFHSAKGRLGRVSEDAARQARYAFLIKVLDQTGADGVITAHHTDDRCETSIFNLMRGSGRIGLVPMTKNTHKIASGPPIIRPLLAVSKQELADYAARHGLPWREDSTNRDISFSRNFIRHEFLPLARLSRPDFDSRYLSQIQNLESLNQAIDQDLSGWLKTHAASSDDALSLPRRQLWQLSHQALVHLLAFSINYLRPGSQLTAKNLQQLARLTKTGSVGCQKTLASGLRAIISYDTVTLVLGEPSPLDAPPADQSLAPGTSLRFGRFQLGYGYLGKHLPGAVNVRPLPLRVRAFQSGDRIYPVGVAGSKKLQDLFVDRKIPRPERLSYPVATSYNGEVVWVPGLAVGRQFAVPATDPSGQCLTYTVI